MEELLGEVTDERARQALALVLLEELEQVDAERLKEEAQVTAVREVVVQLDDERAGVGLGLAAAGGLAWQGQPLELWKVKQRDGWRLDRVDEGWEAAPHVG